MTTSPSPDREKEELRARLEQLEEINRGNRIAIDQLLSLGDFQAKLTPDQDMEEILAATRAHLFRMVPLRAIGFLMVDPLDQDFNLVSCEPESYRPTLERQIAHHTESGSFAWSLSQSRAALVPAEDSKDTVMFHGLESSSGILGVVAGLLENDELSLDDTLLATIALVCFNCAQALENSQLYRRIKETNRNLEEVVVQRTKSLRAALERANAAVTAKNEFLANISHEIRTPMNAIVVVTDLLLESKLDDEQRENIHVVKESADSLLRVIDDILDVARMEAGKLELEGRPFSLRDCVNDVLVCHFPTSARKGLTLFREIESKIPDRLWGDGARLAQVLHHMLDNAVKFTEEGKVRLGVKLHRQIGQDLTLHFCVEDSGPGIAEDKRELIFESFTQADSSSTRRHGGTGLGLAICSNLVRLMGGKLWVKSEVGKGSRFHFTVNLAVASSSELEGDRIPREAGRDADQQSPPVPLYVLMAESQPGSAAPIVKQLERDQHVVRTAASGSEFLHAVDWRYFDALVLDMQVAEPTGLEVLRALQDRLGAGERHVAAVAITAHGARDFEEQGLGGVIDSWLPRTATPGEVVHRIYDLTTTTIRASTDFSAHL